MHNVSLVNYTIFVDRHVKLQKRIDCYYATGLSDA